MPNSRKLTSNVIDTIDFLSKVSQSTSGIRNTVTIPDYTADRYWAGVLAKRIENFWKNKGYQGINAWVETDARPNGIKIYSVRSNIKFDCSDLSNVLK